MKIPIIIVVLLLVAGCAVPLYYPPSSASAASYPARERIPGVTTTTVGQQLLGVTTSSADEPSYPNPVVQAPANPVGDIRFVLEGCSIIAEDGQMLGVITSNSYDTKSFLNQYGTYGSKYSSTSIWNEYGQYGGQYSSMSPFNAYSSTPPRIISLAGEVIGFLTVDKFKSPGISPYAVVALMK